MVDLASRILPAGGPLDCVMTMSSVLLLLSLLLGHLDNVVGVVAVVVVVVVVAAVVAVGLCCCRCRCRCLCRRRGCCSVVVVACREMSTQGHII